MSPGLAVPGQSMSVLLSPSAFQQSINKTTAAASVVPPAPSEPSSTSVGTLEPPQAACSKTQLQDTLIHLIKVNKGHKIHKSSTVGSLEWKTFKIRLFSITIPLQFQKKRLHCIVKRLVHPHYKQRKLININLGCRPRDNILLLCNSSWWQNSLCFRTMTV